MPQSLRLILLPFSAQLTKRLFNILVSVSTFKNLLLLIAVSPLYFKPLSTKLAMTFSLLNTLVNPYVTCLLCSTDTVDTCLFFDL